MIYKYTHREKVLEHGYYTIIHYTHVRPHDTLHRCRNNVHDHEMYV